MKNTRIFKRKKIDDQFWIVMSNLKILHRFSRISALNFNSGATKTWEYSKSSDVNTVHIHTTACWRHFIYDLKTKRLKYITWSQFRFFLAVYYKITNCNRYLSERKYIDHILLPNKTIEKNTCDGCFCSVFNFFCHFILFEFLFKCCKSIYYRIFCFQCFSWFCLLLISISVWFLLLLLPFISRFNGIFICWLLDSHSFIMIDWICFFFLVLWYTSSRMNLN